MPYSTAYTIESSGLSVWLNGVANANFDTQSQTTEKNVSAGVRKSKINKCRFYYFTFSVTDQHFFSVV